MLQRSSARYIIAIYLTDLLLTFFALPVARWLRVTIPWGQPLNEEGVALYWPMFVIAAVIWSLGFTSFKAYHPQRLARAVDEIQSVIAAIAVSTLAFAGALYFSYRGLSRLLYVYFAALDALLCLGARMVWRRLMRTRHVGRQHGVLIIGCGPVGQRVARLLASCDWMGIQVMGYVDDAPDKLGQLVGQHRVLGTLDQAREVIARHCVEEVVIALPMDEHRRLVNLVASLQELPVNIKVVPDYSEMAYFRTTFEQLAGIPLVGLKEPVIGPIDRIIKRGFDILISALGLIVLAPLLTIIALLIKLSSPGPVIYRSKRLGEGGRPFDMLKFRTMVRDADQHQQDLISQSAEGKLIFDKRKDDPRITPLGRFLRRYSLDELPQLYNVLIGEMSLVGPRPELPELAQYYEPWQRKRFGAPQGMTGWWQIAGRGDKPKYLHVEDDLYYIQNYSLWLDLLILWRTVGAVIKGEGAF